MKMTPDEEDIGTLMEEDLDAKANKIWEQGARQVLGDAEFERLYSTATDDDPAHTEECYE